MPLLKRMQATATASDWTCIYGDHPIPAEEPYICVSYMRERWDGREVTVDYADDLLFACLRHAPSQDAVIEALRSAGIPV